MPLVVRTKLERATGTKKDLKQVPRLKTNVSKCGGSMSAKFKVGNVLRAANDWAHKQVIKEGGNPEAVVVKSVTTGGYITLAYDPNGAEWNMGNFEFVATATPKYSEGGKVRMLERGKLLDTEFYSPVAAGDWLRDNGITGEFELIRVESLGKIKASITVEAA
jgi:hypothetical protein